MKKLRWKTSSKRRMQNVVLCCSSPGCYVLLCSSLVVDEIDPREVSEFQTCDKIRHIFDAPYISFSSLHHVDLLFPKTTCFATHQKKDPAKASPGEPFTSNALNGEQHKCNSLFYVV